MIPAFSYRRESLFPAQSFPKPPLLLTLSPFIPFSSPLFQPLQLLTALTMFHSSFYRFSSFFIIVLTGNPNHPSFYRIHIRFLPISDSTVTPRSHSHSTLSLPIHIRSFITIPGRITIPAPPGAYTILTSYSFIYRSRVSISFYNPYNFLAYFDLVLHWYSLFIRFINILIIFIHNRSIPLIRRIILHCWRLPGPQRILAGAPVTVLYLINPGGIHYYTNLQAYRIHSVGFIIKSYSRFFPLHRLLIPASSLYLPAILPRSILYLL